MIETLRDIRPSSIKCSWIYIFDGNRHQIKNAMSLLRAFERKSKPQICEIYVINWSGKTLQTVIKNTKLIPFLVI